MRISQLWKFGARQNLAAEFVSSASPERHISWWNKCELHGMFEVPKFCGPVLAIRGLYSNCFCLVLWGGFGALYFQLRSEL